MGSVVILSGNPKLHSRTREVAERLVERLGIAHATQTIELAPVSCRLFEFADAQVDGLMRQVAAAQMLIVASPTYKASYTGMLKAFCDRFGGGALADTIAIPVMTGGSAGHALAPEFTLRPLLVELGASVPTAALYVDTAKWDELDTLLDAWCARNAPRLPPELRGGRGREGA